MYQLTVNAKPIGKKFGSEEEVLKAYVRLQPCFTGLLWKKVG